jgi:Flp pilus assembly protein TadD
MTASGYRRMRYLLVMLPLLAAACATAQTDDPKTLASAIGVQRDKSLLIADAAYKGGRYSDAMAEYASLLEVDPKDEAARLGVADCYLAAGDAKQASVIYATLVTSEAPKIRLGAEQGQGLSQLILGALDAGQSQLLKVANEDPSLWRTWNALGWSYDKQRDWPAAEEAYRKAQGLSPVQHVVLNNWGMSLLAQGKPAEAAVKFRQAIELRPEFDVARNNLQLALGLQGKYREALAGSDEHQRPRALNNVGYAAMLRGDTEVAERYFSKSVEDNPRFNHAAWHNLTYLEEIDQQ